MAEKQGLSDGAQYFIGAIISIILATVYIVFTPERGQKSEQSVHQETREETHEVLPEQGHDTRPEPEPDPVARASQAAPVTQQETVLDEPPAKEQETKGDTQ